MTMQTYHASQSQNIGPNKPVLQMLDVLDLDQDVPMSLISHASKTKRVALRQV